MKTSADGIGFIMNEEKFSPKPYKDDFVPTPRIEYSIGYGHQIQPTEEHLMQGITQEKAIELLAKDLIKAERAVNTYIKAPLTQNQFDALVSIAYNTGGGSLNGTKLQALINSRASGEAIRVGLENHYIHSGGKRNAGLVKRRKREAALFFSGMVTEKKSGSLSSLQY